MAFREYYLGSVVGRSRDRIKFCHVAFAERIRALKEARRDVQAVCEETVACN
jgi:hypothetical protein